MNEQISKSFKIEQEKIGFGVDKITALFSHLPLDGIFGISLLDNFGLTNGGF
jgi:hypothetical protein